MDCKANKPYPEIKVERKNIEYAKILLDDYAGIVSEMAATLQYSFQHISKFQNDIEFSKTLEEISIVEMTHLELLGKTIKLLGIEPIFKFNEFNKYLTYFSSSFVDYDTNIINMLNIDIKSEEEVIKNYKYHASIINDKYIKELLYRIILDEKKHIECFNALLKKRSNY